MTHRVTRTKITCPRESSSVKEGRPSRHSNCLSQQHEHARVHKRIHGSGERHTLAHEEGIECVDARKHEAHNRTRPHIYTDTQMEADTSNIYTQTNTKAHLPNAMMARQQERHEGSYGTAMRANTRDTCTHTSCNARDAENDVEHNTEAQCQPTRARAHTCIDSHRRQEMVV